MSEKFFNIGEYRWPLSLYNAELVIEQSIHYTQLYDLLINNAFDINLNLHKSIFSLCDQNSDIIEENISDYLITKSNFFNTTLTRKEGFK